MGLCAGEAIGEESIEVEPAAGEKKTKCAGESIEVEPAAGETKNLDMCRQGYSSRMYVYRRPGNLWLGRKKNRYFRFQFFDFLFRIYVYRSPGEPIAGEAAAGGCAGDAIAVQSTYIEAL